MKPTRSALFLLACLTCWALGTVAADDIAALKQRAEAGDADAQYELGCNYDRGGLVQKNMVEAVKWWRKAAEQGHANAQFLVGWCFDSGQGVAWQNRVEAVKWYRMAAEQGHAGSQYNLGCCYEAGGSVPKDLTEAVKWWRKAAEQGHDSAQWKLGVCYAEGLGLSKSWTEAAKCYRKAAEQGHADAQYDLGCCYRDGQGVMKDDAEAAKWLQKAAEHNLAQTQYSRGLRCSRGDGVVKDPVQAVKWFRKAAEQGHTDAQWNLGSCYDDGLGVSKDPVEALKWFHKAAEQGDPAVQLVVGCHYSEGLGTSKNMVEASKWFRKAAEQGYAEAQYNLGCCYAEGEGVPKDEVEALAWFNLAAASDIQSAKKNRDIMESRLGRQVTLLGQQRSKELLNKIEARKNRSAPSADKGGREATVQDEPKVTGSGVLISDDGLILSATHVVKGADKIRVVTSQGIKAAKVLQVDEANDVAILKCEGAFAASPVRPSAGVRLGQMVFTLGFPNVGLQGFEPKLTKGEISSMGGIQDDPRQWQISAPVQPGNSGGPLFDENGNVVGVVVARLSDRAAIKSSGAIPQNINYAVKSAYVMPLLEPFSSRLPSPRKLASAAKFEDVVQKARESVVLVLAY